MLVLRLLLTQVAAVACVVSAAVLAYEAKDGWGWFLFAALLFGSTSFATRDTGDMEAG